jgi:creatinine amidohydrolase/Fe(II)-dependent formamide hydrolase-like protein
MYAIEFTAFQIKNEMEVNRREGLPNVAAIAMGSIEQHGPLLPLNTDTILAGNSLEEVDRCEGGRLFLYPPIQYTNADSALCFAGTLSISHETLRRILREISACVQKQGFDALFFLDGHSINKPSLLEVAYETVSNSFSNNSPFPVIILSVYQFYNKIKEKYKLSTGKHADWFEGLLFRASGGVMPGGAVDEPDLCPQKVTAPTGIVGIPLQMRSDRGVIGRITHDSETEELRNNIWSDYINMLHSTYRNSMEQFFKQFKE